MNNLGFKAGDLVYCLSKDTKIHRLVPNYNTWNPNYEDEFVLEDNNYYGFFSQFNGRFPLFILATKENYERLCVLYPTVEFENPDEFVEKGVDKTHPSANTKK